MAFTHFDEQGNAVMVDVSGKQDTVRTAVATGTIAVSTEVMAAVVGKTVAKGDVLTVAQVAGIAATKRTSDLIPMCHPIPISGVNLELHLDEARCSVEILAVVSCTSRTGVEMEALTAVSAAALTVYDMCKAVQRDMLITDIRLLQKSGGIHGDYERSRET
jgi:cyclic pyranopterin phosphate synthase